MENVRLPRVRTSNDSEVRMASRQLIASGTAWHCDLTNAKVIYNVLR